MAVKLGNGNWAVKEDKLLAYNDNSGRFFNKEFDFARGSSATYVGRDGLIKTSDLQSTNLVQNGNFSELSSELVTNGNFSNWSSGVPVGWSVLGGSGDANNFIEQYQGKLRIVSNGGSGAAVQQNALTVGKIYKVTADLVVNSGGGMRFQLGANSAHFVFTTTQNIEFYAECTGTNGFLQIIRQGVTDFTIDNVSVKQVDPNNYWTLGTGWSIGNGKVYFDNPTGTELHQSLSTTASKYRISFDLDITSGTIQTSFSSPSTSAIESFTTSGTKTVDITTTASFSRFRFVGIGGSVFNIDNVSVQEIKTNTPRIDFSDSTNGALLLEGQSTNLINQSESFLAGWSKINGVVVSATKVTSPDGTLNASQLIYDGTNNGRIERAISGLTQGADYTVSVYARVSSGTQVVRFGSFNDFEYTLTTEWQRLTKTQPENDTVAFPRLRCDDAATIEIYAFQLEQQSYATSYIPTSGSATTRLADVCNNSGSAQDFNSESGVLYAEIAALHDSGHRWISVNSSNGSNRITIELYPQTGTLVSRLTTNGVQKAFLVAFNIVKTNMNKIAVRYYLNNFSFWVNGNKISEDLTDVPVPIGLSELSFDNGSGGNPFYGKVKDLQVFTTALTDEFLAELTTI